MDYEHESRDIYGRAGIGARLERGSRPGVLVVDFSLGFTSFEGALGCGLDKEVLATRQLLDVARAASAPVIFTAIAYQPGLADCGLWAQKIAGLSTLVDGSDQVSIDARLGRVDHEPVVVKKGASAFFGTNLVALLVERAVDTVVLCGATTSGCVRATAIDLMQHGFPTLVPRECVGDRARAPHESNLFDIDAKYADVVSVGDAATFVAVCGDSLAT
jgi:nicotinamidase-related amidase